MHDETTRRKFLVGIATVGSASVTARGGQRPETASSPDLLPALRARFENRLHPDIKAVRLTKRESVLRLEMIIGPNPAWAGAFCDFDALRSCSELVVVNELTRPMDLASLSPTNSHEENAHRLMSDPELEILCRMIGLIASENVRLD